MRKVTTTSLLIIGMFGFCFGQQTFYIQSGNQISKYQGDPSKVISDTWKVRLYKNGYSASGNGYWGTITGSSAEEVMTKLKSDQAFELRYNAFMGKGSVRDPVYTNFNPLGPIAIIGEENDDDNQKEKPELDDQRTQLSGYLEQAKESFDVYRDAKKNLDKILRAKPSTPFDEMGQVFKEYASNLRDVMKQIYSVRNQLLKNDLQLMDDINTGLLGILDKFDGVNASQQKALNELENNTPQPKVTNSQPNTEEIEPMRNASNLKSVVPKKFQNSILTVIESGENIVQLHASIPADLTEGMNNEQIIYFKKFTDDIFDYWQNMVYCYNLMDEGSHGYGYLKNNKLVIDIADQYYRDEVLKNPQILETDNYNGGYSGALLFKSNAAFDLYMIYANDPNISKLIKNNILKYGLSSANMMYQEALPGYPIKSIVQAKQESIDKLKQQLR